MTLDRPIIFIGMGRSGTTIVSEIIFQHEDLAWPSNYQNRFPDKVWINRLRPLLDNKLWQLRGQKPQLNKVSPFNKILFKPAEAYGFWRYITGPKIDFSRGFLLNDRVSVVEANKMRSFFNKMVHYQKRKRLAFKVTGPGRIGYLSSIFPDAVFIEITREPFSNIRSLLNVSFWKKSGMHQLWWQGAYSPEEEEMAKSWENRPALLAALQYKKIRETTKAEALRHGVVIHSLSYEDFVNSPSETIDKLLSVLGLDDSSAIKSYLEANRIFNRNEKVEDFFESEEKVLISKMLSDYMPRETKTP